LCELWAHLNNKIAAGFESLLAALDGIVDAGLESRLVNCKQDIAKPLPVCMHPVPLIRDVLEQCWLRLIEPEDVLNRQALDLGHGSDHHFVAFYVLPQCIRAKF